MATLEIPEELRAAAPRVAVVLGSGLGPLADALEHDLVVPYEAVTGLPVSRVPGHAGRFVVARCGGAPLLIAQGRVHLYEGWEAEEVTRGIQLLHAVGVETVILTNAAGTVNAAFPPGEWMMLSDHLNLTGHSPLRGGANFFDMSEVYDCGLRERFREAARLQGTRLHEGVYAAMPGPQYETPAEIRMLRVLGADAVGMSTVPEAIQARALGMKVAAFSCLTNWGAGLSAEPLSHGEVTTTGQRAAGVLVQLLLRVLPQLADLKSARPGP
jgi:purine-nucleoside phosphorylase